MRSNFFEGLLGRRLVTLIGCALLMGVGAVVAPFGWDLPLVGQSQSRVSVDAIPDIGELQQMVVAEWPGRSPRDIEDQITYRLSSALLGLPGVKTVRGTSMFGRASVAVVVDEDLGEGRDLYWVRSRIQERLVSVQSTLPDDAKLSLGPDATALGQVFWYTLDGLRTDGAETDGEPVGGFPLHELRTLQDVVIGPALSAVNGVAEVSSIGGFVREYHVDVSSERLIEHDVTLAEVARAVSQSNRDIGASTLEINRVEHVVRGLGSIASVADLEATVVRVREGVALTLADVADVRLGPAERRGVLDKDGREAVGGIVVARIGDNPMAVIERVKARIAELAPGLPSRVVATTDRRTGAATTATSKVTIVPFYDRTKLIGETLATLESALIDQALVTVLVILLMLLNLRASILVSVLLPIAVLLTFGAMYLLGIDANIVALAGIAIAIGTMVDVGIVVVDNVLQRLRLEPHTPRRALIASATKEVAGAVLTAIATTIISFLPVFALDGPEGKLFGPLAWTKTIALIAAAFVAIIVLPVLMSLLFPQLRGVSSAARPVVRHRRLAKLSVRVVISRVVISLVAAFGCAWLLAAHWRPLGVTAPQLDQLGFVVLCVAIVLVPLLLFQLAYPWLLRRCLNNKLLFLLLPAAVVLVGLMAWRGADRVVGFMPDAWTAGARARMPGLAGGFLPDLDEGDFLYMPSTMPHASLGAVKEALTAIDAAIAALPEVKMAVGKLGRAESALDPAPISMIETVVLLEPKYRAGPGGTRVRVWRPEIETQRDVWHAIAEAAERLDLAPGAPLQPIRTRIVMLQSGMKGALGVELRGPDPKALAELAVAFEGVINRGSTKATGAQADRTFGKPYLEVKPDRQALARYGITIDAFQMTVAAALGGVVGTTTVEGREGYDVRVRYPREQRNSPEAIGRVTIKAASTGERVPVAALATITAVSGPQAIRSQDGFYVSYVPFGAASAPDGRTLALTEVAAEVSAVLEDAVASGATKVPPGVSWKLAGDWQQKARSDERLLVLVPIAALVVLIVLMIQLRSLATALMVFTGVAVAVCGGFIMLWAWGLPGFLDIEVFGQNLRDVLQVGPVDLTVGVWVGFIALIGIATDDGVVMATYLTQRFDADPPTDTRALNAAVEEAGRRRVRPCLMTTATTLLALLPVLTNAGRGADIMLPMAIPVVGGMAFELITLFVVPVLFAGWRGLSVPTSTAPAPAHAPAPAPADEPASLDEPAPPDEPAPVAATPTLAGAAPHAAQHETAVTAIPTTQGASNELESPLGVGRADERTHATSKSKPDDPASSK